MRADLERHRRCDINDFMNVNATIAEMNATISRVLTCLRARVCVLYV